MIREMRRGRAFPHSWGGRLASAGVWLVLATALAGPRPAWPQALEFADDFETGDTSAWSYTRYGGTFVTLAGGVELRLKYVPAGTCFMGSPDDERGRWYWEDLHRVTLTQGYYLGLVEVTQVQWDAVTGLPVPTACGSHGVGPDDPVYCVTWTYITEPGGFLDQLNTYLSATGQPSGFRLPTEADWERGARAGTETRFAHGDVLECDDSCGECPIHEQYMWWCGNDVPDGAKPVGSKLANAFLLHDMHGNLWEWGQDWFEELPGTSPVTDPTGPATGTQRVIRGGSWTNDAAYCRSASRSFNVPGDRSAYLGFRLVKPGP